MACSWEKVALTLLRDTDGRSFSWQTSWGSKSLAIEYATKSIRVNAASPGVIKTGRMSSLPASTL